MMTKSVLLVEADDDAAHRTQKILEGAGFTVVAMPDAESAGSVLEYVRPDVVLVAYPQGNRATDNLAAVVRVSSRPQVPVVALYDFPMRSLASRALADGCVAVVPKPVDRLLLEDTLRDVLSRPDIGPSAGVFPLPGRLFLREA